jgi:protein-disulfide isomerase
VNIDGFLGRCVNVVVVVVGVAVASNAGLGIFRSARRAPSARQDSNSLVRSIKGASVGQVQPAGDRGGILLFVSPNCPFCEASVPFYRRMDELARSAQLSVLVALADNGTTRSDVEEYAQERNLNGILPVNPALVKRLGLRGTPTVLAYDRSGLVTASWLGRLTPVQEKEVESQIEQLKVSP